MTGFLIYNLFTNFEMHLSMNLLEYLLDKTISLSFFQFQSESLYSNGLKLEKLL